MSDQFQIIVDVEVGSHEPAALGGEVRRWLAAEGIIGRETLLSLAVARR